MMVLALVLVPFFLFGSRLEVWTNGFISATRQNTLWTAAILALLLASDIFLPVPASIVSTACGFLFGFVNGTLVSFTGMTLGCIIGYGFGSGSRKALYWIGKENFHELDFFFSRLGKWAIVMARPIPVLAEASVLFAGISRMNLSQFMILSTLSNLGISVMYAAVGAFSVSASSFLLAFCGAMALPGLAKLGWMVFAKRRLQAGASKK